MTLLSSNWKEVDLELKRLGDAPYKSKFYLDRVLNTGFKATQAAVHVITGSLKTSGKQSSLMWDNEWHGEISYGGVSKGVNNPVTYAIYEKARDEDHDFFNVLKELDPLFVKALMKVLSP